MIKINFLNQDDQANARFLNKLTTTVESIKEYNKTPIEDIKAFLDLENCYNLNMIETSSNITHKKCYDSKEHKNLVNIIYGDYRFKNQKVEVYLNQRSSKKVKYKKKEYDEIHPIEKEVISLIRSEYLNYINDTDLSLDTTTLYNKSVDKDFERLKSRYLNRFKLAS